MRKKNRRSDTNKLLFRLTNMTSAEWQANQERYRDMQPCDFLFQRILSILTPDDLQTLVKAWADSQSEERRIVVTSEMPKP